MSSQPVRTVSELDGLRGISVVDEPEAVVARVQRGDLCISVTVPKKVLEWFTEAHQGDLRASDWCDYSGYDSTPVETLSLQMAADVGRFLERLATRELRLVRVDENPAQVRLEWLIGSEWLAAVPFGSDGAAFSETLT